MEIPLRCVHNPRSRCRSTGDQAFIILILFVSAVSFPSITSAAAISRPQNNLGLVGYWPFNESGGTSAKDYSGYGDTGTLGNSAAFVAGNGGNAVDLPTTNSFVNIPSTPAISLNTTVTVSYWQKAPSQGGNYRIIVWKRDATSGWSLQSDPTDRLYLRIDTSAGANQGGCYMSGTFDGVWHHIVYVINNGTVRCYRDGVSQGTASYNQGSGFGQSTPILQMRGSIGTYDDLRIYNRALSAAEVTGIYNANAQKLGLVTFNDSQNKKLTSGLVGLWSFDGPDFTDKVYDRSGSNNNGYLVGGATSTAIGKLGQALSLDGASRSVLLPAASFPALGNTFTFSAWIKVPDTAASYGILGQNIANSFGIRVQSGGSIAVYYPGVSIAVTNPGAITPGSWHLVVYSRSGPGSGQNAIYIDGVLQSLATNAGNNFIDNANTKWIGQRGNSTEFFKGSIDDVRLYNRALSAAEVKQLYNEGGSKLNDSSVNLQSGTSLNQGLIGLWTFDGTDVSDKVYDRSGSGNNGYLVGNNNATSSRKTIGKLGQGFRFGGANTGGIDIGASSALTPNRVTVSAWINAKQPQTWGYNYIYSNTRDNCATGLNGISLGVVVGGVLRSQFCNNGSIYNVTSSVPIATSTWTHVAFTYDGARMTQYINGTPNGTRTLTVDPGTPASFDTYIGSMGFNGGTTYTFNGSLDDIRVYNRALSDAEVKQLYNIGQ